MLLLAYPCSAVAVCCFVLVGIVLAVLSVLVELVVLTVLAMFQALAVLVVLLVHVAVHAVHIVLVLSVPTRIHPPTLAWVSLRQSAQSSSLIYT